MSMDNEGFRYPRVDDACVHCGQCLQVCPRLGVAPATDAQPACYAAYSRDSDILAKSSSGGMFTHLARWTLARAGVVFGVGFDQQWNPIHFMADNESGIENMRGSKYLQSDTKNSFAQTRRLLEAGRQVLYTGTPCQIAGLKKFLGQDTSLLLTVDIVCHGVPSATFFRKYLESITGGIIPRTVSFRNKQPSWREDSIRIRYADAEYAKLHREDMFKQVFLRSLCLRPSCGACPFARLPRAGDVTIGDFWNIQQVFPDMDCRNGVSVALLNTERGKQWFHEVRAELVYRECQLSDALQRNLIGSSTPSPNREEFMRDMIRLPFELLAKRYLSKQAPTSETIDAPLSAAVKAYWLELMRRLHTEYGLCRTALYCAGAHTRWLLDQVLPQELWPACLYDDQLDGKALGIPIKHTKDISLSEVSVMVISTDVHHLAATQRLRNGIASNRVNVVDPYANFPKGFVAPKSVRTSDFRTRQEKENGN